MDKLSSSFTLVGIIDGTTINGYVRVDNTPLVQRYNTGTCLLYTSPSPRDRG